MLGTGGEDGNRFGRVVLGEPITADLVNNILLYAVWIAPIDRVKFTYPSAMIIALTPTDWSSDLNISTSH
jgi:hypothetical protein